LPLCASHLPLGVPNGRVSNRKTIRQPRASSGKKPRVDYVRTFGCTTHVKLVGPGITKLSDRSRASMFVGYEEGVKAYRVFDMVAKRL
jgi:hypothetical protein